MATRKPISIAAVGPKHTATIIVAHGLGDTGVGWVFLAEQWIQEKKFDYVKFVFPNAPTIPITVNGGASMPGWYDITSLNDINRSEDDTGINNSRKYFHDLINEEVAAGIPANRIVLGGFSQGGAMALHAGLTSEHKLGGIFGLSSYMLLRNTFKKTIDDAGNANAGTKIFMGHGNADPVVQYEFGKMTATALKDWGFNVDFKTYPNLPHSASPQEIRDLAEYVSVAVPPVTEGSSSQGNL